LEVSKKRVVSEKNHQGVRGKGFSKHWAQKGKKIKECFERKKSPEEEEPCETLVEPYLLENDALRQLASKTKSEDELGAVYVVGTDDL